VADVFHRIAAVFAIVIPQPVIEGRPGSSNNALMNIVARVAVIIDLGVIVEVGVTARLSYWFLPEPPRIKRI